MLAAAFMREGQSTAPFIASFLTLIPLFAVGGLFVLLFSTRTEGKAIVDVRDPSGPVCGLLGREDIHPRKVTFECVAAGCHVSK